MQDLSRWHYSQGWENHFCKLGCLMDFIKEHLNDVIALGPRRDCLETPIEDPKKVEHEGWGGHKWTSTEITKNKLTTMDQIV